MSRSIGELGALALRAVRGAGQPWGVAEEAAWAVRWLLRAGLDGPLALAAALEADALESGGPESGGLDGLVQAISRADRGVAPPELRPAADILTLPFIARVSAPGQAWVYGAGQERFRVWAVGCDAPLTPMRLALSGTVSAPPGWPIPRVEVAKPACDVLADFAARTYAPATEASRLRGAGAGLTDND